MTEPSAKRSRIADSSGALSAQEATQYDRQIRLWGLESQRRIRSSKILVIGATGISAELCKNIVLAGIHSLTLLDDQAITEVDLTGQFLLTVEQIGQNRAEASIPSLQKLNPNVEVAADTSSLASKDDAYFKQFTMVCSTNVPLSSLIHVNQVCRESNIKFFAADVFGFYGSVFVDLQKHDFVYTKVDKLKNGDMKETKQAKTLQYISLEAALEHKWPSPPLSIKKMKRKIGSPFGVGVFVLDKFRTAHSRLPTSSPEDLAKLQALRDEVCAAKSVDPAFVSDDELEKFAVSCGCELGPVAAIMGGMLGGEIIKVVSQKDTPVHNCLFFDGPSMEARIFQLGF